jgi:small conductance mechanosensitive channel
MQTRLLEGDVSWQPVLLAVLATLLVAWLVARMTRRLVQRVLVASLGDTLAPSSPLVRGPLRLVGLAVFLLVTALLMFPALRLAGIDPPAGVPRQEIMAWAFGSGFRVALVTLLAYALIRATTLLVKRFEYELATASGLDAVERGKRARTLGGLIRNVATIAIASIAVLMILREFRIDIAPVLAGAGIAGLALGFGAQTLVRDIISGFFLILEDQVRVGDVATINGTGGLVEEINLRTVVLRDQHGAVHVFPNGAIERLANHSKDFSYYVMDLGITYGEDPDRVGAVLQGVGAELQRDPQFGPFILEPIEVLGIEGFADWSVQLKLRIKTVPLKQWVVGRELRKRIRKAFDRQGIEIPFPGRLATVQAQPDDRGTEAPPQ